MVILIAYLIILLLISLLSYRKGFQNIFRTEQRLPWYLAGFSLFMINPDTVNVLSKMGIVATEGYSGLWIFYSGVLGAGLLPILFAPLWSRLKFMTDNQFILLRFSGKGARILHLFRALYVGYLVTALFLAQIFISLSKLLMVFFELTYVQSYLVITAILLVLIVKNSLQLKIRTDFLNGIIYLAAFAIGAIFVIQHFGGLGNIYPRLSQEYGDYIRLFPGDFQGNTFGSLPTILVYFGIQWWSISVLDGSGPEAQRYMNTKGPFQAFLAAFLPIILFSLIFLFHSFVFDAGILMLKENSSLIPQTGGTPDLEAGFLALYKIAMPPALVFLVFLAFAVAMFSFLEAFINWGASFLVVDVGKTYIFKNKNERFYSRTSYLFMMIIGLTGIVVAWYNTHLLGLQKFIFSMAAGVGPVFILRWFWWRINAWSQFSAMLSSLILAVGWDLLYKNSSFFQLASKGEQVLNMSPYAFKLVCLTTLVSLCWLIVTFLTPPDKQANLEKFVHTVNPGGWWKGLSEPKKISGRKIILILLFPIISILPFLFIWLFKFGSGTLATLALTLWIFLIVLTIMLMHHHKAEDK